MVSFIVRFRFTQEDRAEMAEALRLPRNARQEPGCVSYVPHQLRGDPDTVLIYEQYRDQKALAAHRESRALQEIRRRRNLPEDEGSKRRKPPCSRLAQASRPNLSKFRMIAARSN